jgi:hypothetical protein
MCWRHRLAHALGWNLGRVVSATDSRGQVWIGFECTACGQVDGTHIAQCLPERDPNGWPRWINLAALAVARGILAAGLAAAVAAIGLAVAKAAGMLR